MTAFTFGKYGEDIEYTGVIGDDPVGKKIKEILDNYQIKYKYLETCYTEKTALSYKIYNSKSNKFTSINEVGSKTGLTKFKYEFIPDVIIMDDKDYNANIAAINNYPNAMLIYIADKYNKSIDIYLNKCNYVICTIAFASEITGVHSNLDKTKNLVSLFQKFIDLYHTNLIVKLDNFDILYCVDDEVRIIKNINKNITNKEPVYYSILIYFLAKKYSLEESVKLTNKVMLESPSEIDLMLDIPDYKVVSQTIKEYEEYKKTIRESQTQYINENINNNQNNTQINNVVVQTNIEPTQQANNNVNNNQVTVNNTLIVDQPINNVQPEILNVEQKVTPVELHNPNTQMINQQSNVEKLEINTPGYVYNNQNTNNGVNNG